MAKTSKTPDQVFRAAVIGADTLLGKEVQETLERRSKQTRVSGYSSSGEGSFGEQEGEAVFVEPLSSESVQGTDLLVLAGSPAGAAKSLQLVRAASPAPVVVDAMNLVEAEPGARLASPLNGDLHFRGGEVVVLAHAVSSALALLLARLSKYQAIGRAVVNILEPASEYGQRGISELHSQTTALLAFKPLPKELFDAQLAFNTLAQLGEEAKSSLIETEDRIRRQLHEIGGRLKLQAAVAQTSLRLIQAPVFHGYSLSLYVEFPTRVERVAVEEALASAQIDVRGAGDEVPNSVAAASNSGLLVGDIRPDATNPKAVWLWVAFDNLQVQADSIADLVAALREGEK